MEGKSNRTKEEKARIVMEALTGNTPIAEICRRYNLASSAFYKWRDAFIAGGTASLEAGIPQEDIRQEESGVLRLCVRNWRRGIESRFHHSSIQEKMENRNDV